MSIVSNCHLSVRQHCIRFRSSRGAPLILPYQCCNIRKYDLCALTRGQHVLPGINGRDDLKSILNSIDEPCWCSVCKVLTMTIGIWETVESGIISTLSHRAFPLAHSRLNVTVWMWFRPACRDFYCEPEFDKEFFFVCSNISVKLPTCRAASLWLPRGLGHSRHCIGSLKCSRRYDHGLSRSSDRFDGVEK